MNVARDIAGFALPFTVGVFITVYAGASFCFDAFLASSISLTLILLSTCTLLAMGKDSPVLILAAIAGIGCGILSGITGISLGLDLPTSGIERLAIRFGLRMQEAIDSIAFESSQTNALIKALLTGERTSLDSDIKNAFRASGASHILALSGLHLGMIYLIFSKVTGILGNSTSIRKIRSVTTICLCGFYTLATGAGASIVRAFIFILLRETARLTNRSQNLIQILFAALIIQLAISPMSARGIGFQLSYAAIAGIAVIYPWLKGFWPDDGNIIVRPLKWLWDSAALSISCQLTTGPLAYLYFGTIPKYFMLTNLLALPITGILIPAALLTLCLSWAGWCPGIVIQATEMMANLLIKSLSVIATM